MTVTATPKARRAFREQVRWYRENRSDALAGRWYAAAKAAPASLGPMPESRPICRESDDLPGGEYREHDFGVGKSKTHRLVSRVRGGTVEVVAVRGFAQRDLTPGDL